MDRNESEAGWRRERTIPLPRLISVTESARYLGIGRSTLYELIRRGEIPGVVRLGRRVLIAETALRSLTASTMWTVPNVMGAGRLAGPGPGPRDPPGPTRTVGR